MGGSLQHAALVARETSKPCIAGIEHAAEILRDRQMIEMDGLNGVVRVLQA
ncbi:MAG: PEP-utilizing enzyme [Anaerolineaceae bacterium]|nr:PEP-utilizing enzyme [Anaerolineaceae bacterium]